MYYTVSHKHLILLGVGFMEFMNRNVQPAQSAHANGPNTVPGPVPGRTGKKRGDDRFGGRFFNVGSIVLLVSIAILVGALASYFAVGNNGDEGQYVNKNEYQAVFVNVNGTSGGQVYFGHIRSLSSNYIDLTNVFYIQNQSSSSSSSNNAYTLVKLGCELHGPEDQMIINGSQVYFWENLKSTGQVTQKINQYYKDNPNGQNCSQSSNSSSTTQASTSTQSSTSPTSSSTTPSTSSTTSKP
jgi:hypothetical protein